MDKFWSFLRDRSLEWIVAKIAGSAVVLSAIGGIYAFVQAAYDQLPPAIVVLVALATAWLALKALDTACDLLKRLESKPASPLVLRRDAEQISERLHSTATRYLFSLRNTSATETVRNIRVGLVIRDLNGNRFHPASLTIRLDGTGATEAALNPGHEIVFWPFEVEIGNTGGFINLRLNDFSGNRLEANGLPDYVLTFLITAENTPLLSATHRIEVSVQRGIVWDAAEAI